MRTLGALALLLWSQVGFARAPQATDFQSYEIVGSSGPFTLHLERIE